MRLVATCNFSLLCPFLDHSSPNDLDLVHGLVFSVCLDEAQALNDSHAALDTAKDCVLSVQPWSGRKCNEELTAVCVWPTVGHAQDSSSGVFQVSANLVFEFLAVNGATASTSAGRIACLNHEVRDDTVEDDIVVVAAFGKCREVLACLRGEASVRVLGSNAEEFIPSAHGYCRALQRKSPGRS